MEATVTGAGKGSGQRQHPATCTRSVLGSGGGGIVALTAVTPQQQPWRTAKAAGMAAGGDCSLRSYDDGAGDASAGLSIKILLLTLLIIRNNDATNTSTY